MIDYQLEEGATLHFKYFDNEKTKFAVYEIKKPLGYKSWVNSERIPENHIIITI